MSNSTHKVEVIRVGEIRPHPNADRLRLTTVFSGYQVVLGPEWSEGDLAAYVPPDSLVPLDRPAFEFLKERLDSPKEVAGRLYHRVKTVKLRKEYSMGMLVPVRGLSVKVGDDLASHFEILHYDPPTKNDNTSKATTYGSKAEQAPEMPNGKTPPSYDLESLRRHAEVFQPGETVSVTEKIHGANARYTYGPRGWFSFTRKRGGFSIRFGRTELGYERVRGLYKTTLPTAFLDMRVGSRNQWKRPDSTDIWWRALAGTTGILALCRAHPGKVLYGEVYGDVQDLDYGVPAGEVRFAAFDILDEEGHWLNVPAFQAICERFNVPTVPRIAHMPFSLEKVFELAEGKSTMAKHVREGVVVKPLIDRHDPRVGRVALKAVGNGYLERAA